MPVQILGMIGANPPHGGANLHTIGGGIDADYLAEFAQAHEDAGFDRALIGYSSASADSLLLGLQAAQTTTTLNFLIAHRPGFVSPSLAARKFATLDQFTRGRIAIHIISGGSDTEQHRDGDNLEHDDRYRRSAEYMQIMRKMWSEERPFDFEGDFYHLQGAYSDVRPYGDTIPIYYGGQSDAALIAAPFCDLFATWGEPRTAVRQRMDEVLAAAAPNRPAFSVSVRPIIAPTEDATWDKAHEILDGVKATMNQQRQTPLGNTPLGTTTPRPEAVGSQRLLDFAAEKDIHDERLYMPIAAAAGAAGNTSALVGTPEQVVDSLVRYYDLGISTILIRGFDPLADTHEYGRELIPLLREAVAEHDAGQPQGTESTAQAAGTA
ncbi:MAG TPA: LLM class flavin-dependent oxidoreductase [Dehalococcoidia bacterium]|nr:LLM class flavin-dependent oxidoreductase [Dehalococcoidia bacterium]